SGNSLRGCDEVRTACVSVTHVSECGVAPGFNSSVGHRCNTRESTGRDVNRRPRQTSNRNRCRVVLLIAGREFAVVVLAPSDNAAVVLECVKRASVCAGDFRHSARQPTHLDWRRRTVAGLPYTELAVTVVAPCENPAGTCKTDCGRLIACNLNHV